MKKRIMKALKILLRIVLFCGYFYVLFINLVYGFAQSGVENWWDLAKVLVCAFLIAAGMPGIIWYQQRRIEKLEER